MTITTEEAERLAATYVSGARSIVATALRDLAGERDALQAENARIKELLKEVGSLAASRAGRVDVLEAENARLREVLRDLLTPQTPASFAQAMVRARAALGETQ
jgi:hypothetical protein